MARIVGLCLPLARRDPKPRRTLCAFYAAERTFRAGTRPLPAGHRHLHVSSVSLSLAADSRSGCALQKCRCHHRLNHGQCDLVPVRGRLFSRAYEQSADVIRAAGIKRQKIRTFGFPVSPKFADLAQGPALSGSRMGRQSFVPGERPRILYMINAGKKRAPETVKQLLRLNADLTIAVAHDERLRRHLQSLTIDRKIDVIGWTDDMPRLLCHSHLLIGKAGGATVQETIAAGCPMVVNHVVSGQEEGNARLIAETNSGTIALTPEEVAGKVRSAFADDAKQWRQWSCNISQLSRPRAALDIAEFLLSI